MSSQNNLDYGILRLSYNSFFCSPNLISTFELNAPLIQARMTKEGVDFFG